MRKIFCILSILTVVSPVFADDDPTPTPVPGDPGSTVTITDSTKATNVPGYGLKNEKTTDANAASAGYVKGAYNATIKAVNMVADQKQNKLTSTGNSANITTSGTGYMVNSVTASDGTVTITKREISIPVGAAPTGTIDNGRAPLWIE